MKTKKRLLGILLSLVLILGMLPGMSLTAYADDPYASLKNTTTVVHFDSKDWYLIDYDASTVTLLAKECVGVSTYNSNGSYVAYDSDPAPDVKNAVDNYYNTISGNAKTAVSGSRMFLLTREQATPLGDSVRRCLQPSGTTYGVNAWWLCSQGTSNDNYAAFVKGDQGNVIGNGTGVSNTLGVRPALKLDLSKVTFDSTSNTFSLKPSHTHDFTYSANGATITATCTAAGCDLPESSAGAGDHVATLTIVAPTLTTVGGTGSAEATITDENSIKGDAKVMYQTKSGDTYGTATETAPTDAGKHKASITLGTEGNTATAYVEYEITGPVASVTTTGGQETKYADIRTAVAAWNANEGSTLTPLVDFPVSSAFTVLENRILEIPEGITVTGAEGGSIDNKGTINISGTVDASNGSITTAGTVNVKEKGTLIVASMPQDGDLTVTAGGIIKVPAGGGAMIAVVGNEGTDPNEAATRLLDGTLSFSMTANGFTDTLDEDGNLIVYAWDMDRSAPGATGDKKLINNGQIYVPEDGTMSLGVNTTMTGADGTVIIDGTVDASKGSIEDVGTVKVTEFGTLLIKAAPTTGELIVEAGGEVAVPVTPEMKIVIVGNMETPNAGTILERGTMTFLMEKSGNTYTVEENSTLRVNQWDLDSSFHGANVDKTLVNKGAILVQPDGALTLGSRTTLDNQGLIGIEGTLDASKGTIACPGGVLVTKTGKLTMAAPLPQTGEMFFAAGGVLSAWVPGQEETPVEVTFVGQKNDANAMVTLDQGFLLFTLGESVLPQLFSELTDDALDRASGGGSGSGVGSASRRAVVLAEDVQPSDGNTYTLPEDSILTVNKWDTGNAFFGDTQKTLINDGKINVPGVLTIGSNTTMENNGTITLTMQSAKVVVVEESKGTLTVNNSDGGVHSGEGAEAKTVYSYYVPSGGGGGGAAPAANPVSVPTTSASAASHGKVSSSAANAKAGEKVTVTPQPDEGYVTAGVTVTDAKGNVVPVTQNADGTYSFTMPSTAVTVTPTFVKAGEEPQPPADGGGDVSSRFKDVPKDAWYHDAVQWAVDKGLTNGVSDDRFAPDDATTRAMVVTMLWRLAGEPASGSSDFDDVSDDAWYAEAVAWAASTGAVKGLSEDTFAPDIPVTREQLAAILYRYAQAQGKGFTGMWAFPLDYSDAADVSDYAYEALCWMTMNGIITGMGDGTLAPKANATRAQIATMFMRFTEEMAK